MSTTDVSRFLQDRFGINLPNEEVEEIINVAKSSEFGSYPPQPQTLMDFYAGHALTGILSNSKLMDTLDSKEAKNEWEKENPGRPVYEMPAQLALTFAIGMMDTRRKWEKNIDYLKNKTDTQSEAS